ncbi:MAG: hypothetical protein ACFCVD_12510 [Nodosilinea sp.]
MADDRNPPIRLQLELSADQPGLLEGLETWVRLGLISQQQLRDLCQEQLSCQLQLDLEPFAAGEGGLTTVANPFDPVGEPVAAANAPVQDFLPDDSDASSGSTRGRRRRAAPGSAAPPAVSALAPPTPPRPPGPLNLWLNRLMSELSVVWLLGLGVFLVVLSSAVLAATQWARFSAIGQYLVLLAYTLVFWGAGVWCSRSPNLQLTAITLRMITLLLVPLNFWAMDGLGVWRGGLGVLGGGISALLLTLTALDVLRRQHSSPLEQRHALGLAYLHTGWATGWMPIFAVYGGVLGSAAAILYQSRRGGLSHPESHSWRGDGSFQPLPLPRVALIAALGLLLLRALTVLDPQRWGQLGLAFGLYGATWVWLGQRRMVAPPLGDTEEAVGTVTVTNPIRTHGWSIGIGRGLLVWGWLIAISDWLAQAFGVSVLGLGLRLQALRRVSKRRDLLTAYAIAVQLAFVGWELVPQTMRRGILAPLSTWAGADGGYALLGVSLFPYVVGMVALADRYFRRDQPRLGRFSDGIALGSSLLLTLISAASGPVLVVNLVASTITALVATGRRAPLSQGRIMVSYGLALATVVIAIGQRWPTLALSHWTVVMVTLAVVALLLSKVLQQLWAESAWLYGAGLSALIYALLWGQSVDHNLRFGLSGLGLVIPLVLTLIGRYPASILATGLALPLTLGMPWTRLVGLGTATALTGINSLYHRHRAVPWLALGFGLGFVVSRLEDLIPGYPRHAADWCGVTVGLIAALWVAWGLLSARSEGGPANSLVDRYRRASDLWAHTLAFGLLIFLTVAIGFFYLGWRMPQPMTLVALGGFLLALGWRYRRQVQPLTVYLGGWGLELLLAWALAWRYATPLALAAPTLGLGAVALALAAKLQRSHPHLAAHLQSLTLGYAALALLLRAYTTTGWTGWLVVGAALLALEIGRRRQVALIRWLALGGVSVGWYELVLYQLRQSPGGAAADGLIILAGVAALIMGSYRLGAGRLERSIQLPQADLVWAAHLHWLLGSLLMLVAGVALEFAEAALAGLGLAIATALLLYALSQGRLGNPGPGQHGWVYAGLGELIGWFALLRLTFPALAWLDSGWGVVAAGVAVPMYWLPWAAKGWPQRPWRVMAVIVPLAITVLTQGLDHIPTLWVLVGFYGWLAWHSGRVRVSYLAVGCAVWAVWVWLGDWHIGDSLGYVLPLGLGLLYGAQVDPFLKSPGGKLLRHWLRVVALTLVLLTALVSQRWTGIPVGVMALGAIAAGLAFRTRACLYVGTVIFGLNALNQLILLNSTYPFVKWVAGIIVGIALIWVAADFERRRDQWMLFTQTWIQDLDGWQ